MGRPACQRCARLRRRAGQLLFSGQSAGSRSRARQGFYPDSYHLCGVIRRDQLNFPEHGQQNLPGALQWQRLGWSGAGIRYQHYWGDQRHCRLGWRTGQLEPGDCRAKQPQYHHELPDRHTHHGECTSGYSIPLAHHASHAWRDGTAGRNDRSSTPGPVQSDDD